MGVSLPHIIGLRSLLYMPCAVGRFEELVLRRWYHGEGGDLDVPTPTFKLRHNMKSPASRRS